MIKYKDLFLFKHVLTPKSVKAFSNVKSAFFYDKREQDCFRKFVSCGGNLKKYYITKSTMARIENMDLSKVNCSELSFLYEKYGDAVGLVFNDNLQHFIYAITKNHISILCFNGFTFDKGFHSNGYFGFKDEIERKYMNDMYNAVTGGLIIPFYDENPILLENCNIGLLEHKGNVQDKSILTDILRIKNQLVYLAKSKVQLSINAKDTNDISISDIFSGNIGEVAEKQGFKTLAKEAYLYKRQRERLISCLKQFVFIQTASVVDLDFISELSGERVAYNGKEKEKGIIVVDSFYDSNINVVNPFTVSGHFRNQPKKNNKGEWYKELIYIDSYMKKGYHRESTKCKIEEYN